jgi:DNA adenine methylase
MRFSFPARYDQTGVLMTSQLALFGGHEITPRPAKPALKYYGGKWSLADWVISHFPHGFEKLHYVEPFGGAASVLLQKPRSFLETYNDLDSRLVTFFRVLRERPNELVRVLELTPHSREEYSLALVDAGRGELELARSVFVTYWQGIAGNTARPGWRVSRFAGSRYVTPPAEFAGIVDGLREIAERLRFVQIENIDGFELIARTDSAETLFYMDPPYESETRAAPESYRFEWDSGNHSRLSESLRGIRGYALVSGKRTPLYDELFSDWFRVDQVSRTNSGGSAVESLYLSPRLAAELG